MSVTAAIALMMTASLRSSPDIGLAQGTCRQPEPGPAILVAVEGFKDRRGRLRLELYPANDDDFLADDNILIEQGKTFARTDQPVAATGSITLCIRVPVPGRYTLSLLHDRDANHKFSMFTDGIGFAGNPKLGWSKPLAANAVVVAGAGLTHIVIVLNYRRGFSMRPLGQP
jgi:uncharacterized protein (DUF2141 family)